MDAHVSVGRFATLVYVAGGLRRYRHARDIRKKSAGLKLGQLALWISQHYGTVLLAFAFFACFQAWIDQRASVEGRDKEIGGLRTAMAVLDSQVKQLQDDNRALREQNNILSKIPKQDGQTHAIQNLEHGYSFTQTVVVSPAGKPPYSTIVLVIPKSEEAPLAIRIMTDVTIRDMEFKIIGVPFMKDCVQQQGNLAIDLTCAYPALSHTHPLSVTLYSDKPIKVKSVKPL